jgi:hypothetical protein
VERLRSVCRSQRDKLEAPLRSHGKQKFTWSWWILELGTSPIGSGDDHRQCWSSCLGQRPLRSYQLPAPPRNPHTDDLHTSHTPKTRVGPAIASGNHGVQRNNHRIADVGNDGAKGAGQLNQGNGWQVVNSLERYLNSAIATAVADRDCSTYLDPNSAHRVLQAADRNDIP